MAQSYIRANGTISTECVEEHVARMVLVGKAVEAGVNLNMNELQYTEGPHTVLRELIHQICRNIFRDSDINVSGMGVDIMAPNQFMRIMQFALNGFNMQTEIPIVARFTRSKLIEVLSEHETIGPIFNELMDFMRLNISFRPQYAFFQRIVRIPVSNTIVSNSSKCYSRMLPLVVYLSETKKIIDRLIVAMGTDINSWLESQMIGEAEREIESLKSLLGEGIASIGSGPVEVPTVQVPAAILAAAGVVPTEDTPAPTDLPTATVVGPTTASAAEQARMAQILAEMGIG